MASAGTRRRLVLCAVPSGVGRRGEELKFLGLRQPSAVDIPLQQALPCVGLATAKRLVLDVLQPDYSLDHPPPPPSLQPGSAPAPRLPLPSEQCRCGGLPSAGTAARWTCHSQIPRRARPMPTPHRAP
eukprot:3783-Chlamydomonas_euryale.AAC.4